MPFGPIQTKALGLLSLLDLKSNGLQPYDLSEEVRGIVDLRDLMLLQNRVAVSGSRAVGTGSYSLSCVAPDSGDLALGIPQGEVWYIHNYSLVFAFANANDACVYPALSYLPDVSTDYPITLRKFYTGLTTTYAPQRSSVGHDVRKFIVGPATLGFGIDNLIVGATDLQVSYLAEVTKLRI